MPKSGPKLPKIANFGIFWASEPMKLPSLARDTGADELHTPSMFTYVSSKYVNKHESKLTGFTRFTSQTAVNT